MRGSLSRIFPRMIVGLAVAACVGVLVSVCHAQIGPVVLTKTFTGGPVRPGDGVTLEFTIENLDTTGAVAADIAFTDNLDAVVSGLVATVLPATPVCGPGSQISGTSLLTFSGGSVAAGASCTFSVTLLVPAGAAAGSHINTTSSLTTELNGRPFVGTPATGTLAVLVVGPVVLTKTFSGGAAQPGDSVTLEFTIVNSDPRSVAADIAFTDNLDAVVSGLVATGLPATNVCGLGSQISGTSLLTFSGGSLAAGASCTFSVTLLVPAGAAAGSHLNTTSPLTTQLGGTPFVGAPATGTLAVLALPAAVPTLEWWGLLLLFGLLGLAAWWSLQRGHVPPPASA
jgi:hypothetical protein